MSGLLPPSAFLAKLSQSTQRVGFSPLSPPDQFKPSSPKSNPSLRDDRIGRSDEQNSHSKTQNDEDLFKKIHSELAVLKEMQQKKENTQPMPSPSSIHPLVQPVYHPPSSHLETLLGKQSEEILSLKQQLKEVEFRGNNKAQALKEKISNLKLLHEKELGDRDQLLERLETQNESLGQRLQSSLDELTHREAQVREQDHKIRQLELALEEQIDSLKQVKSYLLQVQTDQSAGDKWKAEKSRMEVKLTTLSNERETVLRENELLNRRLTAMEDILKTQERSLHETRSAGPAKSKQEKLQALVSQWRCKVYQLLVQQKSDEISNRKHYLTWKTEMDSLRCELDKQTCETKSLEKVVTERDTRISVLNNTINHLEGRVTGLENRNEDLEQANANLQRQNSGIEVCVQQAYSRFEKQVSEHGEALKQIENLESCLICAAKQLALLSNRVNDSKQKRRDVEADLIQCEKTIKQLEIQRSDAISQHSVSSEKAGKLEEAMTQMALRCTQAEQQCENLAERLRDATDNRHIEEQRYRLECEQGYLDKCKMLEETIANLKKELAKNVVSLRRLERENTNLKTQKDQEIDMAVRSWQLHCDKLKLENTTLQSERNILQSNLRQKSAISNRPAARSLPESSCESSPTKQHSSLVTPLVDIDRSGNPGKDHVTNVQLTTPVGLASPQSVSLDSVRKLASSIMQSDSDEGI